MNANLTPSLNTLFTATNFALSNVNTDSEFMRGVLLGVLITLLVILLVRFFFWIFDN